MSAGMILDGVFASEAIDSSGEVLEIEGADISSFEDGKGFVNWEHLPTEDADVPGAEIVGKILSAKKIRKVQDCSNEREKMFWEKVRRPFIYGTVRLYDGAGHSAAQHIAAIIRDSHANKEPVTIGWSVEGSTLERKENRLISTCCRRVAITVKACNQTAFLGLMSDPNAPKGFEKDFSSPDLLAMVTEQSKTRKSELQDPLHMRLGGSEAVYGANVTKATSAGSYNVSPGSLTNGAALQVEDRTLKAKAKAAYRDWDRVTPFKKFLKAKLPEASDEFLEHFGDLVDDHLLRVKKAEEVIDELAKAGKLPKAKLKSPKEEGVAAVPEGKKVKIEEPEPPLTIRGKPVKPNPHVKTPYFDEETGIHHTPKGSFPMYIPSHDKENPNAGSDYNKILNDPKISEHHDRAMESWFKAHKLLKAGNLPEEVVMHATLHSLFSPRTSVPNQEFLHASMNDAMQETGLDPRNPEDVPKLVEALRAKHMPSQFPKTGGSAYWESKNLRLKSPREADPEKGIPAGKVGDIHGFQLLNPKMEKLALYHTMHSDLTNLMNRHRGDGRAAVEELMQHKKLYAAHENKRERLLGKGLPDIGEYPGIKAFGLAPKTGRYAMGTMGAGNIMVHDIHKIRGGHGLDPKLDKETIDYLGRVMNDDDNAPLLAAMDRYYAKHHDAVKHMLAHPRWGGQFENPEDAIFPAFWKDWMATLPHEKTRGIHTFGHNEYTDHYPYWETVAPQLNKSEDGNHDLVARTAKLHHEWVQQYGEMPAQMLYFRYLLPQLLNAGALRHAHRLVNKAQELDIDLRKAISDPESLNTPAPPETVSFQGKQVKPGHMDRYGTPMALLGTTPEHLIAIPHEKLSGWDEKDMVKIPRKNDLGFKVDKYPEILGEPSVVDSQKHGVGDFIHHQDIHDLANGFDFGQNKTPATRGSLRRYNFWAKNAEGKPVFVKGAPEEGGLEESKMEGTYHNLARDFFGLGKYVPRTAVVNHPATGRQYAIIEHTGGTHHDPKMPSHRQTIADLSSNGELHKIALMDAVMANPDRHDHNYTLGPEGLKLIDQGLSTTGGIYEVPHYLRAAQQVTGQDPKYTALHPAAQKWLQSLDPTEFELQLRRHGVDESKIHFVKSRLQAIQAAHKQDPSKSIERAFFPEEN
jgi:hypothetical protein